MRRQCQCVGEPSDASQLRWSVGSSKAGFLTSFDGIASSYIYVIYLRGAIGLLLLRLTINLYAHVFIPAAAAAAPLMVDARCLVKCCQQLTQQNAQNDTNLCKPFQYVSRGNSSDFRHERP